MISTRVNLRYTKTLINNMITKLEFNTDTRQFSMVESREFGAKSKMLGYISPGGWHAKEAGKYMHDNEVDYKKNRSKYALRGHFAPVTSMYIGDKVSKMHKEGKSAKEIHAWMEKNKRKHAGLAVAEAVTGSGFGIGHATATGYGLYKGISDDRRKKFDK